MNSTPRPALHLSLCRFEFRIVLACLLAWIGTLGLGGEARGQDLAGDRQALVAFYNATDGANWRNNRNWLSDEPLDAWAGVTVWDGRVLWLNLSSNQLTGPIPAELGNLSSLTELSLYNNRLTGPIPAELGDLSSLTALRLFSNQLTGPIPATLGNLSSLRALWLDSNQLTGSIPATLGNLPSLTALSLASNRLTGPIPAELGALTSLWRLSLGDNQLTGPIPAELGNLSSLTELYLSRNQLTGSIPAELGNLSSLTELLLYDNQLTGPIPQSFTNLTLERFYFNGNPGLCAQADAAIQTWLSGIGNVRGPDCSPPGDVFGGPGSSGGPLQCHRRPELGEQRELVKPMSRSTPGTASPSAMGVSRGCL